MDTIQMNQQLAQGSLSVRHDKNILSPPNEMYFFISLVQIDASDSNCTAFPQLISIQVHWNNPLATSYFDLEKIYLPTGIPVAVFDAKVILKVMLDQVVKALDRVLSVFFPPIHGYGKLVYDNVSSEEWEAIWQHISYLQYHTIFKVYYDTYDFAIHITNSSEQNAKRHAFFVIYLVKEFGEDTAKEIADAHERGRPGSQQDNCVDALNNKAAIKYANDNPGVDPADGAHKMWTTGLLVGDNYEGCMYTVTYIVTAFRAVSKGR